LGFRVLNLRVTELGRNGCKSIDVANAVRGAKRSSDSRIEVPAADVCDRVKHDGERKAVSDGSRSQSVLSSVEMQAPPRN